MSDPGEDASPLLVGLPAVVGPAPTLLVLGSMPGTASLDAARYYAHPRNAAWPAFGALLGFDPELPYEARLAALRAGGVALWDVVHRCRRRASADATIRDAEANDVAGLLARTPSLRAIGFNGRTARQAFDRLVAPRIAESSAVALVDLPSTSPAFAAVSVDQKVRRWVAALSPHLRSTAASLPVTRAGRRTPRRPS